MLNILESLWFLREYFLIALDILLLYFFIYQGYRLLVRTRAAQLIRGAIYIAVLYLLAYFLKLQTLLWVLNLLAPSVVIALAIIFQPEIRKIFLRIGQGGIIRFSRRSTVPFNPQEIISASMKLAECKRGALIVISRNVSQASIIDKGIMLDANLNMNLLLTVLEHDTRLHDGAIVIENGRVAAASCLLPLSENMGEYRVLGTRHRAALGLAEDSDAVIVVVSEENSALSLAYDGKLHYQLSPTEFSEDLIRLCSSILISNEEIP